MEGTPEPGFLRCVGVQVGEEGSNRLNRGPSLDKEIKVVPSARTWLLWQDRGQWQVSGEDWLAGGRAQRMS